MRTIITITFLLLLTACGGGGGGGGNDAPSVSPTANVTGEWGGTYSSNITGVHAISLKLQGTSTVTGTFASGTGVAGTFSGTVTGNTMSFNLTNNNTGSVICNGSYSGTGTVSDSLITFTYSGTDCGGTHTGQGSISRLPTINSNVGWSGNWWHDSGMEVFFVSLETIDSVNYSGYVKIINTSDASVLTANLNGQYGWGKHPESCDTCYNWMLMSLSNIQGSLSVGSGTVLSGSVGFTDYTGSLIRLSGWSFEQSGGGTYYSGGWFKKI